MALGRKTEKQPLDVSYGGVETSMLFELKRKVKTAKQKLRANQNHLLANLVMPAFFGCTVLAQ